MTEFDLIWTDEEKQEAEKEAYNQALNDVLFMVIRKYDKNISFEEFNLLKKTRLFIPRNDTLDVAIKALEKQIPKKIIVKNSIRHYCPSCDLYFDSRDWKSRYCGRCGQAIEWE